MAAQREPANRDTVCFVLGQDDIRLPPVPDLDSLVDRHDIGTDPVFTIDVNYHAFDVNQSDPLHQNIVVSITFRFFVASELGDQLVDLEIEVGTFLNGSGYDQRRPRFVDQNGVDFVHDRKFQVPQDLVVQGEGQVVTKVVETEFVIGRVGDIGFISRFLFVVRLSGLRNPDSQTEELVNRTHPVGVTLRQVFVDGDDMNSTAR